MDRDGFLIHTDRWVDVIENHDDYEFLFNIPTENDIKNLKPKDFVKISNGVERFFVRVTEVRENCIIGIINNHLRGKYDYDFGNHICFEGKHIFMITKEEDIVRKNPIINKTTARMLRMLGKDPAVAGKETELFESIQKRKEM